MIFPFRVDFARQLKALRDGQRVPSEARFICSRNIAPKWNLWNPNPAAVPVDLQARSGAPPEHPQSESHVSVSEVQSYQAWQRADAWPASPDNSVSSIPSSMLNSRSKSIADADEIGSETYQAHEIDEILTRGIGRSLERPNGKSGDESREYTRQAFQAPEPEAAHETQDQLDDPWPDERDSWQHQPKGHQTHNRQPEEIPVQPIRKAPSAETSKTADHEQDWICFCLLVQLGIRFFPWKNPGTANISICDRSCPACWGGDGMADWWFWRGNQVMHFVPSLRRCYSVELQPAWILRKHGRPWPLPGRFFPPRRQAAHGRSFPWSWEATCSLNRLGAHRVFPIFAFGFWTRLYAGCQSPQGLFSRESHYKPVFSAVAGWGVDPIHFILVVLLLHFSTLYTSVVLTWPDKMIVNGGWSQADTCKTYQGDVRRRRDRHWYSESSGPRMCAQVHIDITADESLPSARQVVPN